MLEKRNELLKVYKEDIHKFYDLIKSNIQEYLPIIYTPTIADAVKNFKGDFLNAVYLSIYGKDNLKEKIKNICKDKKYKIIVLTDSEAILGIGDWGANGVEISIGKSMIYSLCNIDPNLILPVVLDVGTDNKELLNNKEYVGLKTNRIKDDTYFNFIDEVLENFNENLDNPLFHFEDFKSINAIKLLKKYRNKYLCFNDDIQGTASVVLAGLLSSLEMKKQKLSSQIYLCFGAGTAGMGIANLVYEKMLKDGLSINEAKDRIYLFDRNGLVLKNHELYSEQERFSKENVYKFDTNNLIEVIKNIKPTILVGTSGIKGAFNTNVLESIKEYIDDPIIFSLSNPKSLCESDPNNVIKILPKAYLATGSNYMNFSQANNALIFPAIALYTLITNKFVTNDTLILAAKVLAKISLKDNKVLPSIDKIVDNTLIIVEEMIKEDSKQLLWEI